MKRIPSFIVLDTCQGLWISTKHVVNDRDGCWRRTTGMEWQPAVPLFLKGIGVGLQKKGHYRSIHWRIESLTVLQERCLVDCVGDGYRRGAGLNQEGYDVDGDIQEIQVFVRVKL